MRTFLRNFFQFCAGGALLILGLLFTVLAIDGRPPPVILNNSVTTVVVGDSHIQCAVDDSALPGVVNLSMDSEGYIFSYAKLRYLLQQNPGIEKVILGCGPHNFSSYYEEGIWGEKSGPVLRRYTELLTPGERAEIILRNPCTLKDLSRGISSARFASFTPDGRVRFIGAFEAMNTGKPTDEASILKRIRSQFYIGEKVVSFSVIQRRYLDKIVQLCREQGKTLILLGTPLHEIYRSHVPPAYQAHYDAVVRTTDAEMVDFHDMVLPGSSFLPDGDHVNSRGAQQVTEYLARYLRGLSLAERAESGCDN